MLILGLGLVGVTGGALVATARRRPRAAGSGRSAKK
jgi:hypothetical protein